MLKHWPPLSTLRGFEAAQGAQGRPVFEHIDKFL